MDEKSLANKIAAIMSDDRVNHIVLAVYTERLMTPRAKRRMSEWSNWHKRFDEGEFDIPLDEFDM